MSPSDLITAHADAVASADLDAVLDLYTDDAHLLSYEWVAEGADAVRERFQAFFDFHAPIESVDVPFQQTTDDAAFATYVVRGGRGSFEIVNAFDLRDGACARHFSNEVGAALDRDEVERSA